MKVLTLALILSTAACASAPPPVVTPPAVAPPVVVAPSPIPAPPATPLYDGRNLTHFGSWLDARTETAAFTNVMTVQVGCQDDALYANALADVARDMRSIVWTANVFHYGPTSRSRNGYFLDTDFPTCWQELRDVIANHLDRTVAIWLMDEPDAVAWGDQAVTGYDPNLYNDAIAMACAVIHADLPTVPIALNYADAEPTLTIPSCLSVVGIESYAANWRARVAGIESKTAAAIWILSPAFMDGADVSDAVIAQRLRDQYAYARLDSRIAALYPFLWCCDDTTTGNQMFYTISGGHMPLTRTAFIEIGQAMR